MDLVSNSACIVSVGIGEWYGEGIDRLERSLIYHGWGGKIMTWKDWPNEKYGRGSIYNIKAAAFDEAIKAGHDHILWLDSSVWALQDPMPIFDIIAHQGHFTVQSGFNGAQICSDKCLEYFGVDRDTAESYPSCAAGIMGFNLRNPRSQEFMDRWLKSCEDGMFEGSHQHDNQSADERFLFYRHDQSCATILMGELGMKIDNINENVCYYHKDMPDSIILTLRGM